MAIDTLYMTKNDLQPTYKVTVQDSTEGAVDITGATIRATMKDELSTALTINRSTAGISITAATSGQFEYQWQAGDTDSTGTFDIEFEITPASGGKFTVPNPQPTLYGGVAHVIIQASLDAT